MHCILIVDDDSRFRQTLALALESHGYETMNAADGAAALQSIVARAPHLIVLDWQLPGMDGLQTCQTLRESSDIPVIMISGNRSNRREAALNAGANDYLTKPFSVGALMSCIESALQPRVEIRKTIIIS